MALLAVPSIALVRSFRRNGVGHCRARRMRVMSVRTDSDFDDGLDDLEQALKDDIQRMSSAEQQQRRKASAASKNSAAAAAAAPASSSLIKELVDKLLIVDFFFVLLILAWFLLGLGENVLVHSSRLLDWWFPLWTPLFQPALGLLMAGAIVSALVGRTTTK